MTHTPAGTITVQLDGGAPRTFDGGREIRIGRAPEVDLFVDDPLVSRVHAILAWRDGWVLVDNGSTNGVFADGYRLAGPLPIAQPVQVHLGDPQAGTRLTLTPARGQSDQRRTSLADLADLPPVRQRDPRAPVSRPMHLPAAGLTIGRTADNDLVVDDVLTSRRHARLIVGPAGLQIEDLGSVNGTFVNGTRQRVAVLHEGDTVTIGNVDFVVAQGNLIRRPADRGSAGLALHQLGFAVDGAGQLLVDVSLTARPGSLTAVIGPSGAGKSTLAKLVAGTTHPSAGIVTFEGRNLHAEYEALRSRIGMVPQDDVLHRQLTVRQALGYAAELRLPPDTSSAERDRLVAGVLAELELSEHADTRVDRLSGGQRKRASVALELLTRPSLLILDEPTSGLDPSLDRQVMTTLRGLADTGLVVLVITHSLTYLGMCDQVLLLAPGGKTAYVGNPGGIAAALGSSDWADIFARVAADPDGVFRAHLARSAQHRAPPPVPQVGPPGQPPQTSVGRQVSTVARRQLRLILADRGYLTFLLALPIVLGVLALVVPGTAGFTLAPQPNDAPSEPQQLMVLLILGAGFMGAALSVRDLVGERTIYHRERAVGLHASAYLLAKTVVFCAAATLQTVVLMAIVLAGKPAPPDGVVLSPGWLELGVDLAATACCSVTVGLLLSALARSSEQVMPLLVVTVMAQFVMCGGLIPVTGRAVLDQLSWLFPARWGYAAGASTVDMRALFAQAQPDSLWQHLPDIWLLDLAMLVALAAVATGLTFRRLRLKAR